MNTLNVMLRSRKYFFRVGKREGGVGEGEGARARYMAVLCME